MRSDLPSSSRLILHTLGFHMNLKGERCQVGTRRLMAETKLAKSTLKDHLANLEGHWIRIERGVSDRGDPEANIYRPLIPEGVVRISDEGVRPPDYAPPTCGPGVVRPSDPNSAKNSIMNSTAVEEVFMHWETQRTIVIGEGTRPKMQRTKPRVARIRARLSESYSVRDLCNAIDGCLSNPKNVKGGYTDIELICRDQGHVEQYLAWYEHGPPGTNNGGPSCANPEDPEGERKQRKSDAQEWLKLTRGGVDND